MPTTLFHYCSNQTFCSIVQSRSIWLSSLSLSNDSMEGKWLRQLFEVECRSSDIGDHHISDILGAVDFVIDSTDGLGFCLSEVGDLLSQWRGYSDNGGGLSIGFNYEYLSRNLEARGEMPGYRLSKVSYGDLSKAETVASVLESLKKSTAGGDWNRPSLLMAPADKAGWEALTKKRIAASFPILLLMVDLYRIKNPAFSEEQEWRLLSLSMRDINEPRQYRARGDAIIPFRIYPLDMESGPILSVTLGPRNKSNEKDVSNLLRAFGFEDVTVVRSAATYR